MKKENEEAKLKRCGHDARVRPYPLTVLGVSSENKVAYVECENCGDKFFIEYEESYL